MKKFGKAQVSQLNPKLSLIKYASKRHPGHEFSFKRIGSTKNNRGNGFYHCVECRELKIKYKLNYKIPNIKIVNGVIANYDPEAPQNVKHFCVPGTEGFPDNISSHSQSLSSSSSYQPRSKSLPGNKNDEIGVNPAVSIPVFNKVLSKSLSGKDPNGENSVELESERQKSPTFEQEDREHEEGVLKIVEDEEESEQGNTENERDAIEEPNKDGETNGRVTDQNEVATQMEADESFTLELEEMTIKKSDGNDYKKNETSPKDQKSLDELDMLIFGLSPPAWNNLNDGLDRCQEIDQVAETSSTRNADRDPNIPNQIVEAQKTSETANDNPVLVDDVSNRLRDVSKTDEPTTPSTSNPILPDGSQTIKYRNSRYLPEYEEEFPEIKPSKKGHNYFHCKSCHVDISFAGKGRDSVNRHVNSKRHHLKKDGNGPVEEIERIIKIEPQDQPPEQCPRFGVIHEPNPTSETTTEPVHSSAIDVPVTDVRTMQENAIDTLFNRTHAQETENPTEQATRPIALRRPIRQSSLNFKQRSKKLSSRKILGKKKTNLQPMPEGLQRRRDSNGRWLPISLIEQSYCQKQSFQPRIPQIAQVRVNDYLNNTLSSTSISFLDDHTSIKRIKMEPTDLVEDYLHQRTIVLASTSSPSTFAPNSRPPMQLVSPVKTRPKLISGQPKNWNKICMLREISHLSKKVYVKTSEWDDLDVEVRQPNADVLVPSKKIVDMESLLQSEHRKIAKKGLASEFERANQAFVDNQDVHSIIITDSLLRGLDEVAIEKAVVIRAEFPIIPRWVSNHISSLSFKNKSLVSIYCVLGFDWLIHFESPPNNVATFVQHELLELADAVEDHKEVKVVFVTIPEIGHYKSRFSEFNETMRVFIKNENRKSHGCAIDLIDWAELIFISDPSIISTFDRRIRILAEHMPDIM